MNKKYLRNTFVVLVSFFNHIADVAKLDLVPLNEPICFIHALKSKVYFQIPHHFFLCKIRDEVQQLNGYVNKARFPWFSCRFSDFGSVLIDEGDV